jgi:dolichyl-phosphate mannosyltransferase polypeptide 3
VLPFWAIVSFGAYLLFSLGWGVLTFKDTEKAYDELVLVGCFVPSVIVVY